MKKGKGHLKNDNGVPPKKKENSTQNKTKPICMTEQPSYDKISQPRYW